MLFNEGQSSQCLHNPDHEDTTCGLDYIACVHLNVLQYPSAFKRALGTEIMRRGWEKTIVDIEGLIDGPKPRAINDF